MLVHGFGGDLDNWLFNIDAITDAGPVYALDLPGHGGSTKTIADPSLDALADAAEQFLDGLKLERVNLVGHSMGGALGRRHCRAAPPRSGPLAHPDQPAGLGEQINGRYIDGFVAAETRRDLKPVLKELFADENLVSRQMIDDLLKFKRLDGVRETLRGLADAMFKDGRQARSLAPDLQVQPFRCRSIGGRAMRSFPPPMRGPFLRQASGSSRRRVIW